MILQIERSWNRDPGWFSTLPKHTQIALMAEFRMRNESQKRTEKRSRAAKRARLDRMKAKATRSGAVEDGR